MSRARLGDIADIAMELLDNAAELHSTMRVAFPKVERGEADGHNACRKQSFFLENLLARALNVTVMTNAFQMMSIIRRRHGSGHSKKIGNGTSCWRGRKSFDLVKLLI